MAETIEGRERMGRRAATRRTGGVAPRSERTTRATLPTARTTSATARATSAAASPDAPTVSPGARTSSMGGAAATPSASPYAASRAPKPESPRKERHGTLKAIAYGATALISIAVIAISAYIVFGNPHVSLASEGDEGFHIPLLDLIAAPEPDDGVVSLSAVGDNLMHWPVINTADAHKGTTGDGAYDWGYVYGDMDEIVATHDINFIDIETPMGGDEKGLSGGEVRSATNCPVFNTPSDNAAGIAEFGFNLATTASNHTWDMGFEGVKAMSETWAAHPEVVVAGSYVSQEDRDSIRTFEKNGITFAFLAYTSALNDGGPSASESFAIPFLGETATVRDEIARAKELADVVIVSCSWGAEYVTDAIPYQTEYAQFLANQGVDLILGFHPHVIGPVEWLEGPDGHRTLCAYSLGNLTGYMDKPECFLTGAFTCDFTRGEDGSVTVGNPGWIPLVIHTSGGADMHTVRLANYTAEQARTHDFLGAMDDPLAYLRNLTYEVIDPEVVSIDL